MVSHQGDPLVLCHLPPAPHCLWVPVTPFAQCEVAAPPGPGFMCVCVWSEWLAPRSWRLPQCSLRSLRSPHTWLSRYLPSECKEVFQGWGPLTAFPLASQSPDTAPASCPPDPTGRPLPGSRAASTCRLVLPGSRSPSWVPADLRVGPVVSSSAGSSKPKLGISQASVSAREGLPSPRRGGSGPGLGSWLSLSPCVGEGCPPSR